VWAGELVLKWVWEQRPGEDDRGDGWLEEAGVCLAPEGSPGSHQKLKRGREGDQ